MVFGFAEISWRALEKIDDSVWIHSPVTGRNRQVFEANRSDSLLGGGLSLDDIFVWSGRVQSFEAKVIEDKQLFVPFPSLNIFDVQQRAAQAEVPQATLSSSSSAAQLPPAIKQEEKGYVVGQPFRRSDGTTNSVLWNLESRKYPTSSAWTPASVTFVPRQVWVLELNPRNPFYASGRQLLVIDQESMLPVYKVVYARDGSYKKTVIGAWGLASSADGQIRFPFSSFVIAVPQSKRNVVALGTNFVESFLGEESKQAQSIRSALNIQIHAGAEKEAQKSSSSGKKEEHASSDAASKETAEDEAIDESQGESSSAAKTKAERIGKEEKIKAAQGVSDENEASSDEENMAED